MQPGWCQHAGCLSRESQPWWVCGSTNNTCRCL